MMDTAILFRATCFGVPVTVGQASGAELAVLAGAVAPAAACDVLECWNLVALRIPPWGGIKIHALGWRVCHVNIVATSPLVAVDLSAGAVRTISGDIFRLGRRDGPEIHPELHEHLGYALRTWGFDDVLA